MKYGHFKVRRDETTYTSGCQCSMCQRARTTTADREKGWRSMGDEMLPQLQAVRDFLLETKIWWATKTLSDLFGIPRVALEDYLFQAGRIDGFRLKHRKHMGLQEVQLIIRNPSKAQ